LKIAGLNIEGDRLRAVVLDRKWRSTERVAALERDMAGEDDRTAALGEFLRELRTTHGATGVVIGLGFQYFSHQYVDVPLKAEPEIRAALGFEMEKHLPLPPGEYVIDFHMAEATDAGTRNLVLAARRDRISWIVEAAANAGIALLGVRCTMTDALSECMDTRNTQGVVFAFQEADAFCLVGIEGSRLAELKVLRRGSNPAIEMKEMFTRFPGGIYIAGVEERIQFKLLNAMDLPYDLPELLAASASGKRSIDMDFRPPEARPVSRDPYPIVIGALAALCVLLYLATGILGYYRDSSALADVESRLAEIKSTSNELVSVRNELMDLRKRLNFLKEFRHRRNSPIQALGDMSGVLPADAWLTGFNAEENGSVLIRGYARRAADIVKPLEQSAHFRSVEFASPVTVVSNRERFSISMEVEE
jgi:hypothetical protein